MQCRRLSIYGDSREWTCTPFMYLLATKAVGSMQRPECWDTYVSRGNAVEKYAALEGCEWLPCYRHDLLRICTGHSREAISHCKPFLSVPGWVWHQDPKGVCVCVFYFLWDRLWEVRSPPKLFSFLTSAFSLVRKQWTSTIFTKKKRNKLEHIYSSWGF